VVRTITRGSAIALACAIAWTLAPVSGRAGSQPAPEGGTPVAFAGAEREIKGVLFRPQGEGPFPAIVEIHGINGISEWDYQVARKLVAEGYVTLAVDMFGRTPRDYGDGLRLRDRFRPKLQEDLLAASNYLRSVKGVAPDRVGALGWCMGGGYALLLAVADPRLAASVIYYGPVTPPPGPRPEDLARIHAPMIGFFGQEDTSIPMNSVKLFANNVRAAGKEFELHVYPDAGHGFAEQLPMAPTHGEHQMSDAAADAWTKTLAFLSKHLSKRS
jgi:carboxymethylenebutenolidase